MCDDVGVDKDQAMADVHAATRRFRAASRRADAARAELAEAMREASAAGVRQVDLVNATGYTREHVRRLLLPPENPPADR